MQIIQQWSKVRENSPRAIVTLLNFLNGSSPILSIAGPASRHPKEKVWEGKTTASDRCGSGLRQEVVQEGDTGCTRV